MIIVTGTGRSGTSFLTKILIECGCPFRGAWEKEKRAGFEDPLVVGLNRLLFNHFGLNVAIHSFQPTQIEELVQRYGSELKKCATQIKFAKDPAFSKTLEIWLKAGANIEFVIVCLRNISNVVASALQSKTIGEIKPFPSFYDLTREMFVRAGSLFVVLHQYKINFETVFFPDDYVYVLENKKLPSNLERIALKLGIDAALFKEVIERAFKPKEVKYFSYREKEEPGMAHYKEGERLYKEGDVEGAIKAFNQALKENPYFALAHNDLAFIYWQKSDLKKALYHIAKAMELAPDDRDIVWNCGQILLNLGYVGEACEIYKAYLQKHPEEVKMKEILEKMEQDLRKKRPIFPELNFERYQRLMGIAEEVEIEGKTSFSLLDVGGEDGYFKKFVPQAEYHLFNGIISARNKSFLPYEDNSFDVVVAADVLEHVVPEDRKLFIYELIRVARHKVVVSFPNEKAAESEALLLSIIPQNKWLKEHQINGLPRVEEFEKILNELGVSYKKKPNSSLPAWIYSVLFDYVNLNIDFKKRLNAFLQEKFYETENGEPAYRYIYTIEFFSPAEKEKVLSKIKDYLTSIKQTSLVQASIVIPVFNKLEYTKQCLDALYKVTPNELFELIIVNNGSTDGTKDFLDEFAKTRSNVKVIHNQENLGFAKACNQGARAAEGKYLVFLNNDTIPLKGWLEEMLKVIEDKEHVGVVGSKLLYPDNTIQHAGVAIANTPHPIYPYHIHHRKPADVPEVNVVKEYQAVTGACMLIPKELFNRLGGFDEGFLNGYEDIDLCFRVREAGYKVIYTPKSVLYHYESISEGRFKAVGENVKRLHEKWLGKIRPDGTLDKKVSVVILNYKLPDDTIECINSVYNNLYEKFQIIVVDNASKDGSVEKIINWAKENKKRFIYCNKNDFVMPEETFKQELVIIENEENLGFPGGNNVGIDYALKCGADYIWFLNNDTVIDKDALYELVKLAETDKKIGAISSKLYFYEDPTKVQFDGEKADLYKGLPDIPNDTPRPSSYLSGCSFFMRKEAIESVGPWDEDYFLYFDDNDMVERVIKKGWKTFYNPFSKVYHKGAKSTGGWLKSPLSVYYVTRNLLLFHYKHRKLPLKDAFLHLKNLASQFIRDYPKLFSLIKGVEDFIYGRTGKAKIDFSQLKFENTEFLSDFAQDSLGDALHEAQKALLAKPNASTLDNFLNIAQKIALEKLNKEKLMSTRYYKQGEDLYNEGKVEEAISAFNKALEIDSSFALAHNNLAFIYWQKKDVEKALHHITKAMELAPDDRDIIWNCGQIMLGLGYTKDAYEVYKNYLQKHPEEEEIRQVIKELEQKLKEM